MVDCKSVSTPMELNFKKLSGSVVGSLLANPTEYRQLVEALMFLGNIRPDVCCAVNTSSQHMVDCAPKISQEILGTNPVNVMRLDHILTQRVHCKTYV